MSNILDFGVNGSFPSKVGGTGATVKYFPRLLGINGTTIGSAGLGGVSGSSVAAPLFGSAPATPSANSAIGSLFLPAQNTNNSQQLNVLATGTVGNDTGDPSAQITVQVYVVTGSLLAPTYTSVATTGLQTPSAFGTINTWAFNLDMYGASGPNGGGFFGGSYIAYYNGAIANSTPKTTTTVVSGLDFLNGNPALQQGAVCGFVVGITFATSDASNTASLYEFTIES